MAGLVEEIQRDALAPGVAVSTILRKVKTAAAKLGLGKVEDWVEHELNGFFNVDVPAYRKLHGRPQAFNPYQGWIPIIMGSDRDNDLLAKVDLRQSLPSLEDLVVRSTAGFVEMQFPPAVIRELNKGVDVELGRMSNHLSVTQVQGVIDAVRNLALDWALELERAGISGHGFTFDATERSRAQSSSVTYNIQSIGSFTGNMGTGNTTGNIEVSVSSTSQILDITRQIRCALSELERAGADGPSLIRTCDAIEVEAGKPKPNNGRLRSLLSDAREAMVGAAGNLTAEGAMSLIASALKLLGGS